MPLTCMARIRPIWERARVDWYPYQLETAARVERETRVTIAEDAIAELDTPRRFVAYVNARRTTGQADDTHQHTHQHTHHHTDHNADHNADNTDDHDAGNTDDGAD